MLKKLSILLLCFNFYCCTSQKLLRENRSAKINLNNCKIETAARDTIINKLYLDIKKMKNQIHTIIEKENIKLTQTKSRFQICRKSLLDCKVSKSNLKSYNELLKKALEANE